MINEVLQGSAELGNSNLPEINSVAGGKDTSLEVTAKEAREGSGDPVACKHLCAWILSPQPIFDQVVTIFLNVKF